MSISFWQPITTSMSVCLQLKKRVWTYASLGELIEVKGLKWFQFVNLGGYTHLKKKSFFFLGYQSPTNARGSDCEAKKVVS